MTQSEETASLVRQLLAQLSAQGIGPNKMALVLAVAGIEARDVAYEKSGRPVKDRTKWENGLELACMSALAELRKAIS